MTKKQAQQSVQEKLASIKVLMDEAAALMDEHGFTVSVGDLDYIPRGLDYDDDKAADGDPPLGFYFEDGRRGYERYYAGKWMSSSSWKGC